MNLDFDKINSEIEKYCEENLSKYTHLQLIMYALSQLIPSDYGNFEKRAIHTELLNRSYDKRNK